MESIHQEFIAQKGFPLTKITCPMKETVYHGLLTTEDKHVVVKRIPKSSNEYSIASFLHSQDSPLNHTIPFWGILSSDEFEEAFLVMPALWGLRDFPITNIDEWKDFSMQLLEGVAFMHSHCIAHMDLTPANILVDVELDDDFKELSPRRYCFIDFQLSRVLPSIEETVLNKWGTQDYLAPEVSDKVAYNPFKADVWAIGEIIKMEGLELESPQLQKLINSLQAPPNERCTAQEGLTMLREIFTELDLEYNRFNSEDARAVAEFLERNIALAKNMNEPEPDVKENDKRMVELIKLLKANLHALDGSGWKPLHIVASRGHVEVVRLLVVKFHADVNVKDSSGQTPLHLAAQNGHAEVARSLVAEFHADVNVKDNKGQTPLHFAGENRHIEVARLLVAELHADVNVKDNIGHTPLHLAGKNGDIEVARLLVAELHADINAKDSDGQTPLHLAEQNGHIEVARLVAELHADVSVKDSDGQTPLHLAGRNEDIEVAGLPVVELHADVNTKDSDGQTPLHLAEQNGHIEVARLVSELHADVNVKDSDGQTPLHLAGKNGDIEVAGLPVAELHADVSVKDSDGQTPPHLAGQSGDIEEEQHRELNEGLIWKFTAAVVSTRAVSIGAVIGVALLLLINLRR